jgi:hypothetical protein
LALVLALALATSTQAAPLASASPRRDTGGGCALRYHRGVGGTCVQNYDGAVTYHPDPYWTPCDYSLGPSHPEGCAE